MRREGDFIFCDKPRACRSSVIGQLSHYADVVGILGFGDAVLAGAFDRGILKRPADFYELTERKLLSLDRMGSRLAKRLLREIDRARKLDLATFLRAFGMHEVGKLVSELLAEKYGALEKIYAVDEVELATIPRIGPTIARAVVRSLKEAKDEIEEARKHVEIVALTDRPAASAAEATRSGLAATLAGLSFVFTGSLATLRRAEAERMVKDRGAIAAENVTRALRYLVVGEQRTEEKSSKEKLAEKLIEAGAPLEIISEKAFLAMVKAADERGASPEPTSSIEPTPSAASAAPLVLERAPAVAPRTAPASTPRSGARPKASELAPRELKDDPEPDRRKEDPMLLAFLGGIRARTTSESAESDSEEKE